MFKTITASALAFVGFFAPIANAEEFQQRYLRATDGTEFTVAFKIEPKCDVFNPRYPHVIRHASPVTLTMGSTNSSDKIYVQVEFWKQDMVRRGSEPNPVMRTYPQHDRSVALQYVGHQWFRGELGPMIIREDVPPANESWRVFQTLRVTVNGRALIDPVNGTDRFVISLDDGRSCSIY